MGVGVRLVNNRVIIYLSKLIAAAPEVFDRHSQAGTGTAACTRF